MSKISEKLALLRILEELESDLDYKERNSATRTEWYDTDEQKTDNDGRPMFADDGTPLMKRAWREVPKETLDEDDVARISAINVVRAHLEKLV